MLLVEASQKHGLDHGNPHREQESGGIRLASPSGLTYNTWLSLEVSGQG